MDGIPVYCYFYSYLPVNAGATATYQICLAYGFYGSLPSASHGNLSLVGKFVVFVLSYCVNFDLFNAWASNRAAGE